MRFKIVSVFAAVALLAACETAPTDAGGAGGEGAQTGGPGATTARMGPAAGTGEDFVVNVGDRVFFDFDKYDLKPEARATLEKQAAWLKKFPGVTVTVEGHCDERGTREYNLGLGERRANSAKNYLISLGVSPNRVKTLSYGEERPVALGSNEAAWAQNRRSVTVVSGGAGS